jgi:hypothetical protein
VSTDQWSSLDSSLTTCRAILDIVSHFIVSSERVFSLPSLLALSLLRVHSHSPSLLSASTTRPHQLVCSRCFHLSHSKGFVFDIIDLVNDFSTSLPALFTHNATFIQTWLPSSCLSTTHPSASSQSRARNSISTSTPEPLTVHLPPFDTTLKCATSILHHSHTTRT